MQEMMQAVQGVQEIAPKMPPANPDWLLIQAMYLQGKSPKEIEAETGVKALNVSVRATRKGWTAALAQSKLLAKDAKDEGLGKAKSGSSSQLNSQSEHSRRLLAAFLARSADKLESLPIPNGKAALKASQELEAMVRNAKTVFGWDTAGQAPAVRISIMASSSLVQVNASGEIVPESTPEPAPIEIESVPVLEQSKPEALPEG